MTSIFKSNKFFRIIKHFVLCIPLIFCLGVSIYAIVNPNAKDSYYGETINENEYIQVQNIKIDNTYYLVLNDTSSYSNAGVFDVSFSQLSCNVQSIQTSLDTHFTEFFGFSIRTRSGGNVLDFFDENHTTIVSFYFGLDTTNRTFELYFKSLNTYTYQFSNLQQLVYLNYSYLDNAFAYGMYQFNQIGFNKFDFVGLFDGIFTDNIHNVYTDFINSYLNYYLMIECVYFVPWVIHMFIHFAYDLGDYFTSSFRRKKEDD